MAEQNDPQQIIDAQGLIGYANTLQEVPPLTPNATIIINDQFTNNYYYGSGAVAGGGTGVGDIPYSGNTGNLDYSNGFTYYGNILTVYHTIKTGNIYVGNIYYPNGQPWDFGNAQYSNANVANYLPTYQGNLQPEFLFTDNLYYANGEPWVFGSGTPGGANTYVQFNNNSAFGGSANFTYSDDVALLTVVQASVSNLTANGNVTLGNVSNLHISGGANGLVLQTNGSGNLSWAAVLTTPGGSNTQVQFNNQGNLGGSANFTYITTTGVLTAPFHSGDGGLLSNINGANVVGNVATAVFAYNAANATTMEWANISNIPLTIANLANSETDAVVLGDKGIANGVVPLDANVKIDPIYLPPSVSIGNVYVVDNLADVTALTQATPGDVAIVVNENESYILRVAPPTDINNWQLLLAPTGTITSVNGYTGPVVTLTAPDVGAIPNTSVLINTGGMILNGNANANAIGNLALGNVSLGVNSTPTAVANTIVGRDANASFEANVITGNSLVIGNITANGNVVLGDYANVHINGGNSGQVLTTDGLGNLTWEDAGISSPAGSNTQVQFNNSGEFGATAQLTFSVLTNTLSTTQVSASNLNITTSTTLGGNVFANTSDVVFGSNANVHITGGTAGQVLSTLDGNGTLSWTTASGTPGGNSTEVQFNDSDSFAGNSLFTYDSTSGVLSAPSIAINGFTIRGPQFLANSANAPVYQTVNDVANFSGQSTTIANTTPLNTKVIIWEGNIVSANTMTVDFAVAATTATNSIRQSSKITALTVLSGTSIANVSFVEYDRVVLPANSFMLTFTAEANGNAAGNLILYANTQANSANIKCSVMATSLKTF